MWIKASIEVRLLYLTFSFLDTTFSIVCMLFYQANPKVTHLMQVKKIIKYINITCDYRIMYSYDNNSILVGYFDADRAVTSKDRNITLDRNINKIRIASPCPPLKFNILLL